MGTEPKSAVGVVLTLQTEDTVAEVTTVGAHLRRFRVGAREVIVPFGDELPWGAHGAVLAPWPNRLEDGQYTWGERTYRLPITEPERNTAIHGLVMRQEWAIEARSASAASLSTRVDDEGYPSPLELSITYSLEPAALSIDFTARNIGQTAAPFGVGFHPWLAAGPGGLEAATLQADTGTWYRADSRLLPLEVAPLPTRFDFRSPAPFGDTVVDDAFGDPNVDAAGRSWVRLTGDDGLTAAVWMIDPLQIWQLCSDPGPSPRQGLAAEPMSCPANAFRTGDHLHTLPAGEEFTVQWGLALQEGRPGAPC